MKRLETVWPQLVAKCRDASRASMRAATLAACEFAITHAKVVDPLAAETLASLREGKRLDGEQSEALQALAERRDNDYLDLQEDSERQHGSPDDYMPVFKQALAIAALVCACNEDAFDAAVEAIYEAAIATGRDVALLSMVERALEGSDVRIAQE